MEMFSIGFCVFNKGEGNYMSWHLAICRNFLKSNPLSSNPIYQYLLLPLCGSYLSTCPYFVGQSGYSTKVNRLDQGTCAVT